MSSRLGLTIASLLVVCALSACTPEAVPKPDVEDAAGDVPSLAHDYIRELVVVQTTEVTCGADAGELAIEFLLLDEDGAPVPPGEAPEFYAPVVIEGTETNLDVRFDQMLLFPSPQTVCSGDGDCSDPATCADISPTTEFEVNFECGVAAQLEAASDDVTYSAGDDTSQAILLLLDYSQSLEGVNPDGSYDAARSTDPQNKRISGAQRLIRTLERYLDDSAWEICVGAVYGTAVDPIQFPTGTAEGCFSDDVSLAVRHISQQTVGETGESPIWAGLQVGLDALAARSADRRSVVLFTDGPDDVSEASARETVLASALGEDIELHIIQLDNPPPEGFDGPRPRLGPLPTYADFACETGGTFHYARNPDDLSLAFARTAAALAGQYRVTLARPADVSLDAGPHRLAGEISVQIGFTRVTAELGGDIVDPTTLDEIDSRLVVFVR